jgi:hypothetical protein
MEPVNSHARPEVQEFLVSPFPGERIVFQGFQVGFDDPSALVASVN